VTWLSVNFGLPAIYDHPAIELLPPTQIVGIRYAAIDPSMRREVLAVYDDATRTILLPEDWTGKAPADLSILVHEMVHHLQNVAGLKYECAAAREKAAYAAQEAWLALFGQSLVSEFELNQVTLKLATQCSPP
jgi:hypothetical protein